MPPASFSHRLDPQRTPRVRLGSSLAAALPVEGRGSVRQGWAGENRGLFEHPTGCQAFCPELFSDFSRDTVRSYELLG